MSVRSIPVSSTDTDLYLQTTVRHAL
ncbi:rCG21553 [Rattus norvegicus]|uniref:RCG21553 n=1 Tax=Rattus norvegicus TaxID=10116 RepID=A6J195_RAT|nr:rCG21553 [Rattus norvegicus]